MFDFDLFVIGGGSGGVRAARMASESGARVGLAEQSRMGGTCVIRGCVPKKLMVNAADFGDAFQDSVGFGWSANGINFDWKTFREAKDREILRLEKLYRANLEKAGVRIFDQHAELADSHTVRLADGQSHSAKYILIATGGAPFLPDIEGIEYAVCSDDIFLLDTLPNKVAIVGGGYIACEFATILNGLGSEVTQFYRGQMILRGFDNDIQTHVCAGMRNRGIDIRLECDVAKIEKMETAFRVTDKSGPVGHYDLVLYATGRRPRTAGLGLEAVGVALGKQGEILVDDYSQSSVPSIFAVGDVTDRVNLTPMAIREGAAFVQTIFAANPIKADHNNVATAVFTRPEVGTVGLTQSEAEQVGQPRIHVTRFRPLSDAIAERDENVLMKIVEDSENGRVLGVHIVSPHAAELIQLAGIAIKMKATKEDFDHTVAVHPTLAEELVTL